MANLKAILERLLRKLDTSDQLIYELLQMDCIDSDNLSKKLFRIEEVVTDDILTQEDYINKLRQRVIVMWINVARPQENKASTLLGVSSANGISDAIDDQGDFELPVIYSEEDLSRDAFRSIMEAAFCHQLGPVDNINGYKRLLTLVAKANVLSEPFRNNNEIISEVFGYAFSKLPDGFQIEYTTKKLPKSLIELRRFLDKQIVNYYAKISSFCAESWYTNFPDTRYRQCKFCRQIGHLLEQCLQLKASFCVECFEFGHRGLHCQSHSRKCKVRYHLKNVFRSAGNVKSLNDICGLKHILMLTAKAKHVLVPFRDDRDLNSFICASIGQTLPFAMRDTIMRSTDVLYVERQIQKEITNLCFKRNQKLAANVDQRKKTLFCQYCKLRGHSQNECSERDALLCTRCFVFGHSIRMCLAAQQKLVFLQDIHLF